MVDHTTKSARHEGRHRAAAGAEEAFGRTSRQQPAGRGPWRIGVVSGTILVLELAFIRLIPAEVHAISYFTNLVLMASFFGLGLGCILQRRRSLLLTVPAGALLLLAFVLLARGVVIYSEASEVHYWLLDASTDSDAPQLPLAPSAIVVFMLAAAPFVGLGQRLAREMERFPRLVAYSWDIAGSLVGTLIFTVASFLHMPPWCWLPVLMSAWALLFERQPVRRLLCVGAGLAYLALASPGESSRWSP